MARIIVLSMQLLPFVWILHQTMAQYDNATVSGSGMGAIYHA
jgi:hypothetical protein